MLFDVQAALAEIEGDMSDAPAMPAPSRQADPPGAIVHLSRHHPKANPDDGPIRALPTHPATCAICEGADWTVAMTDRKGRTLHVSCWKSEGGAA